MMSKNCATESLNRPKQIIIVRQWWLTGGFQVHTIFQNS